MALSMPTCRELTTRAATADDREWFRSAHHHAYRDLVKRQYGAWVEADQDRFFAHKWTSSKYEIVLCDSTPCGYVFVEDRPRDIHIAEIVIIPEFQARGIGTLLLTRVIDRARDSSVPVRLRTAHANRAAALYRRLGFREVGTTATHLLFEWAPQPHRPDPDVEVQSGPC
ncbi:MAG: GNAT family N-acetyltransferase [Chloroflexi bacterium]|nr:GNAT family N-acetyltransferase [Chloroflexota bacterium]